MSSSSHREVFCKKGLKNLQNSQENTCIRVTFYRVLARSYLMMLCVIFPIHVNFPIPSSCVLKATIHRKKVNCFTLLEKAFFFQKDAFMVLYIMLYLSTFSIWSRSVSIFHVSLSIIIFTISRSLLAVLSQYSWKRVVRKKKNIRKKIQCRYTGRYCNYQKQPPGVFCKKRCS